MSINEQARILVVEPHSIFRETLAQWLRDAGHEVVTADTGERAFVILRDWSRPIGWLYTRAALPGLIDGWILADEYHDTHADRAVVISASAGRLADPDIILAQPSPTVVLETLLRTIGAGQAEHRPAQVDTGEQQEAA